MHVKSTELRTLFSIFGELAHDHVPKIQNHIEIMSAYQKRQLQEQKAEEI